MDRNRTDRLHHLDLDEGELEAVRVLLGVEIDLGSREWRRLQLLELLQNLPIGSQVVCPACGGGGDTRVARQCPGECCQVCGFCMGRRFFCGYELQSSFPPQIGDIDRVVTEYWKSEAGKKATDGTIIPRPSDLTRNPVGVSVAPERALRVTQREARRKKTVDVPLVQEDASLVLYLSAHLPTSADSWPTLNAKLRRHFSGLLSADDFFPDV